MIKKIFSSDRFFKILFTLILFSLIYSVRKISFQNFILNYDEAEWIYCLKKMISNPLPYRGFDSNTTGPIAIYLLYPLSLISNNLSIISLRLYGLFFLIIPFLIFLNKKRLYFAVNSLTYTSFLLIIKPDFLAYNTEWLLIPFLFIIHELYLKSIYSRDKPNLIILSALIIILPFIKFQSILFSTLYTLIICYNLFKHNRRKELYFFLLFLFIIFSSVLFLEHISIGYSNFKYYFFDRNMHHNNLMRGEKSLRDIFYIYRQQLKNIFSMYFLVILIIVFYLLCFKKYNIKTLLFRYESLLLIVTLLTILIPKTNFTHYFQLLFIPLTIIISKLIIYSTNHFKYEKYNLVFLCVIIFLLISNNSLFNKNKIEKLNFTEIPNCDNLKSNLKTKSSIFIFGWFKTLPIYYALRNDFEFINPSGHTFYLKIFKNNPNRFYYTKELNTTLKTLNSKLDYVLDPEGEILIINDKKINFILSNKYKIIGQFRKGKIYKRI